MASQVTQEFAKLSLHNPAEDYTKLMADKIKNNPLIPTHILNENWSKISAAARVTIWNLLFDDKKPEDKENLEKASELLKIHKQDACLYEAEEYNKWIVRVRDELLKRNMLEFWKNEIVKNELGPCWAKDSNLFDNLNDTEPANFYNYANCKAPWLQENAADFTPAPETYKTLKKISMQTPLEDYNYNMETLGDMEEDDSDVYNSIFEEVRNIIWQLLFADPILSCENSEKAAAILEEYKGDACFYSPLDYNDWILKVRDELLKGKYFDFWQDVVVKKQLGLCWAGESDYFRNLEDTAHEEFYKVGEDFIKKQNKL